MAMALWLFGLVGTAESEHPRCHAVDHSDSQHVQRIDEPQTSLSARPDQAIAL
jgi:hypothetical protein